MTRKNDTETKGKAAVDCRALVRRLIAQQQRMYDALRRIARDYRKAESILRRPEMGLDGDENLAMAYDNIQSEAAAAIKGIRRADAPPNESSSPTAADGQRGAQPKESNDK